MTIFDVILLIILGGFVLFGLWFGVIHALGAIVGTFAGAFFAGLMYEPLGSWLETIFGYPSLMRIFAFIFIFLIVNRLIGFGFYILDKMFGFLKSVPFLQSISRLFGAIIGFFEGVLVVGLSLFIIARFPISDWFTQVLQASKVAPWFIEISSVLQLMLPELLKQIEAVI